MSARILVAEDSATQAEALQALLEDAGHAVTVARSGEAALAALEGHGFDLLLSDVVMPGMSGYDLCRRVKAEPRTRSLPVVLLTSLGDPMDIVRGLEAGADNYITKPYDPEHLAARVGHVLARGRLRRTSRTSMGVTVSFMGTELAITSEKEQIIDLLLSSIEDVIRTNRKLEESRRALEDAHARLEAYARDRTREARTSTERYRTLMQNAGDAIFVLGPDGGIVEANARAGALLGLPLDQLLGRAMVDFVAVGERDAARTELDAVLASGRGVSAERTLTREDGGDVQCEATVSLADLGDERLAIAIFRDVSERRLAEERLRRSERRLAEAQHIAHLGNWDWDLHTGAVEWSDEMHHVFGTTPAEFGGTLDWVLSRFHPADREEMRRAVESGVSAEGGFDEERRIVRPDGEVRVLHARGEVVCDAAGNPVRMVGTAQDVTARREAERRLEESEQRYRSLFLYNPDAVFSVDGEGRFTSANPACTAVSGYEAGELLGQPFTAILAPDAGAHTADRFRAALAGEPQVYQTAIRGADGRRIELSVTNSPIVVAEQIVGVFGIAEDITERTRAEVALRQSEEMFRTLTEASPVAILLLDDTLRVRVWNSAAERIFGWRAAEVAGRHLPFVPGAGRDELRRLLARLAAGEALQAVEVCWRRRDGTPVEASLSATPVRRPDGSADGIVAVVDDITERKRAREALRRSEEQLRQAQKMEAVGQLAGGIAHDFNNLLTVIKGSTQMLLLDVSGDDPLRGDLCEIDECVDRAANLTRQLLTFSRKQVTQPRVLDLNAVVGSAERLLRRVLGETIEVETGKAADLWPVRVDPGQMEQVLMNLAVNARDAMPGGGRLTVETENARVDRPRVGSPETVEQGAYVVLRVCDTGVGMPPAVRDKVFEPFFTTKPQGQGTGLGLSTVYGIVKQAGGVIQLRSEAGRGTALEIFLPPAEGVPEAVAAAPAGADAAPRGGTVLLVEDEVHVRGVALRILRRYGYTVLVAAGGAEALALIDGRTDPIDLIITDVVMPGVGGREVAAHARGRFPGVRVLLMSGYPGDEDAPPPGTSFIHKPFSPEQLIRCVDEAMEGAPAR